MDIKSLRKMRDSNTLSNISKEIEKISNPQSNNQKDERFWNLERDEAGNGSATIRFLANEEINELPWTRIFSHGFKGPTGKWYIENSLSTIGQKDPVGDLNSELWNSGLESNKEVARAQKRRLNYIANILVINDPKHPENNGKVKLFRFGKKIFDKISDKTSPTFEDEKPMDVFNPFTGADFKLRIRDVEGYANYDKSEFAQPSELCGGNEEEMVKVLGSVYSLAEFTAADQFKTYEQLKRRLDEVLGTATTAPASIPVADEKVSTRTTPAKSEPAEAPAPSFESDDADLDFFKSLAEG